MVLWCCACAGEGYYFCISADSPSNYVGYNVGGCVILSFPSFKLTNAFGHTGVASSEGGSLVHFGIARTPFAGEKCKITTARLDCP